MDLRNLGTMANVTSPSRAVLRNAALRAAARANFPGVAFRVRNGSAGWAAISWVDGPVAGDVERALRTVPANEHGTPWAFLTRRSTTVGLAAVGYLRARRAGEWFYAERGLAPGDPATPQAPDDTLSPSTISVCHNPHHGIAGDSVTEAELDAAAVLATVADAPDLGEVLTPENEATITRQLARTLFVSGAAIEAVLMPTAP